MIIGRVHIIRRLLIESISLGDLVIGHISLVMELCSKCATLHIKLRPSTFHSILIALALE